MTDAKKSGIDFAKVGRKQFSSRSKTLPEASNITASSKLTPPDLLARLANNPKADQVSSRADVGIVISLKKIGFSDAEIHKLVVSKRSLERRYENKEPLSVSETDRALRLARIHDHALRVFGSEEKANRWLRKPCHALDGIIPLDLLASETGAHIVESELHAIDHGMFA